MVDVSPVWVLKVHDTNGRKSLGIWHCVQNGLAAETLPGNWSTDNCELKVLSVMAKDVERPC